MTTSRLMRLPLWIGMILLLITVFCMQPVHASGNEITAYLTISNDGEFVKDKDGNPMIHVPVKTEYFDLKEYGLEKYYRYEADSYANGGAYISDRIVEQPTLLHLLIRATEEHYLGRTMTSSDMSSDAMTITGSATSLYFQKFWGHDENFNYYVNHAYPLQKEGWGATCDYLLMEDEDEIDIGMFSDWNFYKDGAFAYFSTSEATVAAGTSLPLHLYAVKTNGEGSKESALPMAGEAIRTSTDGLSWSTDSGIVTDASGSFSLRFDKAGTYYVSAGPSYQNYSNVAPPVCIVTVTGSSQDSSGGSSTGGESASGGSGGGAPAGGGGGAGPAPVNDDKTEAVAALTQSISAASALNAADYTLASYQALTDAIQAAETLSKNPEATAVQLQEALAAVETAKENLVKADASSESSETALQKGDTAQTSVGQMKVLKPASEAAAGAVSFISVKDGKRVTVPKTVKLSDGKTYYVTAIAPRAFAKSKVKTVTIKTKKLTKASVKGSLKGSKVKTIKVKVGSKAMNKKYVKLYKKIFTKKNAGRKVKLK